MTGIILRRSLCAIVIALSLSSVTMKSRSERVGPSASRPARATCDPRSLSGHCTLDKLHKPLRILNSLNYFLLGTPKNKGDERKELPPSTSTIAPQPTEGVTQFERIKLLPTSTYDVDEPVVPDLEGSIVSKNLHRLENEPCGVSFTNTNEDEYWTSPGEYPWLALLQYKSTDPSVVDVEILCGGSLINDRYVLTTAYCLTMPDYELSSVRLGEYNLDYFDQDCTDIESNIYDIVSIEACHSILPVDYEVSEVISHPDFMYDGESISASHDIGLVRLAKQVKFTNQIGPVCLPVGHLKSTWEARKFDSHPMVVGWGINVVPTKSVVSLTNAKSCKELLNEDLSEEQFCIEGDSSEIDCPGDIGSPLFSCTVLGPQNNDDKIMMKHTKSVQFGIMSSVFCNQSTPLVFTSVELYLPWILKTMEP